MADPYLRPSRCRTRADLAHCAPMPDDAPIVDIPIDRYALLMRDDNEQLTAREIAAGWHFCHEFDGLLVGPGMMEMTVCDCFRP